MIHYRTDKEIELLRKAALLVGKTLGEVGKHIRPGIRTIELDRIAEEYIRDNGAIPAFKGYGGFPGSLCISVNDAVVHGIPGNYELKDGDIVSVDCGTILDGYVGDSAYTFTVGEVSEEIKLFLQRSKESLYKGIEQAVAGNRIGDIGYAIQSYVEQFGYGVVRELVGHGVGRKLHEDPQVPNYGKRGTGTKLSEGIVIAIEPMVTFGKRDIIQERDGWTIKTKDRMPAAHFEHDVAIRNGKAEILSSFEWIEEINK
ncbi:MAG: type I methionyl aminopeptidase [Bacteroidales bacterium]|nr:type I methionyl aminopeptidase [Bacteroidales bacterium]MBO5853347.1 type I methionyl aminopeptidase [Bacteroidales bacterium]